MPAPPYPQPRRALYTSSLERTGTVAPISPSSKPDPAPNSASSSCPARPSTPNHASTRDNDNTAQRRAFSVARDTKASIARAARSRYPSAPLRRSAGMEGGQGCAVPALGSSRPVTPAAIAGLGGHHKAGTGSRPVTPASPAMPVTPTQTPRAAARSGTHSMSTASTPRAIPSAATRTPPSCIVTPTKPHGPEGNKHPQMRATTPGHDHHTPRSKPLPFPPAASPTPTKHASVQGTRNTSAMSFYDRLSSLTSSTRGTVGRAHSTKGRGARQEGRGQAKETKGHVGHSGAIGVQTGRSAMGTCARSEIGYESTKTQRSGGGHACSPETSNTLSSPTSALLKPSRSSNWLKRMGSTTFARTAARSAPTSIACPAPTSSPARRVDRMALTSPPRTPERKLIDRNTSGDGSPWISARTLAVEDPVGGITGVDGFGAEPATCLEGFGRANSMSKTPSTCTESASESTSRRSYSATEPKPKAIRRKPAPSMPSSLLRDVELQWLKAIEVEIMSAAEAECLANAQCISIYDPWGDSAVHDLYRLTAATAFGLKAGVRAVINGAEDKCDRATTIPTDPASVLATPWVSETLPPGEAGMRETDRAVVSPKGDDLERNRMSAASHPATSAVRAPCPAGMTGLHRSDTATSALSTTSSATTSSFLPSTPCTPRRMRNVATRLQGDMRDDLDYLYDTFTLDDGYDADVTITAKWDCLTRPGQADDMLPPSPWQLIMPSPRFSRPYEGVQMDDGWVVTTPERKVRGLRRVDTLGSLRSR